MFCLSVFALIGYQLFHGMLRRKCVLKPTVEMHTEFDMTLTLLDLTRSDGVPVYVGNQSLSNYIYHKLDQRYFPHEHSLNDVNDEFSMKPCDNSEAANAANRDASGDAPFHSIIRFNSNLNDTIALQRPAFLDNYTEVDSMSYSWCYSRMVCAPQVATISKSPDAQWIMENIAGRMDHHALFTSAPFGVNRAALKSCRFSLQSYAKRRVTKEWEENDDHHLK